MTEVQRSDMDANSEEQRPALILVVENDELTRQTTDRRLNRLGFQVVSVRSTHEATEQMTAINDVAVILLELSWSPVSELEFLDQLLSQFPQCTVIVCGTDFSHRTLSRLDDCGVTSRWRLLKPYRFDHLFSLLRDAVRDRQQERNIS